MHCTYSILLKKIPKPTLRCRRNRH